MRGLGFGRVQCGVSFGGSWASEGGTGSDIVDETFSFACMASWLHEDSDLSSMLVVMVLRLRETIFMISASEPPPRQ